MVEVHLPQALFALSNECVTQRSRLRVLLHFMDNTYNFGVFCFGLANCYFADRGAKREKKKLNHPVRDKNRKNYSAGSRELSGTYGSYSRLSNIIEAQGLLKRRIALEHGTGGVNALLRKGEFWGGLATALFSPEPFSRGAGTLAVADRVLRSVPGKMATGKSLAALGENLQSPVTQGVVGKSGVAAQATVDQDHQDNQEDTSGWTRIRLGDGRTFLIHPEDLAEARRRIRDLQVLDE